MTCKLDSRFLFCLLRSLWSRFRLTRHEDVREKEREKRGREKKSKEKCPAQELGVKKRITTAITIVSSKLI